LGFGGSHVLCSFLFVGSVILMNGDDNSDDNSHTPPSNTQMYDGDIWLCAVAFQHK
jgi:hypothetical protein